MGGAQLLKLVSVLLVAACLRPAITSVGPLLRVVADDTSLGEFWLGLLGAIPLIMFAVFSPLAAFAARPRGMEFAILLSLVALAIGIVTRSVGGPGGLWLGTAVAGAAVAIANVLTPVIVKRDFLSAPIVMAAFITILSGFAAIASGTAIPLSTLLGGWRQALLCWALLPVGVSLVWMCRMKLDRPTEPVVPRAALPRGYLWRSMGAWQVTVFFGLQSATFYTLVTWLPSIEHSFGVADRIAGIHLLVYQVLGSACGLAVGFLMHRRTDQRLAAVGISLPVVVAMAGLAVAPAMALIWIMVAAVGAGAALTVSLNLVILRTTTDEETAALSGMAQSVGYAIGALGPLTAGLLADVSGWTSVLTCTAAVAACQTVLAFWAGNITPVRRMEEEERIASSI